MHHLTVLNNGQKLHSRARIYRELHVDYNNLYQCFVWPFFYIGISIFIKTSVSRMHIRSLKEKSPQLSLLSLLSYQISIIKKSKLYCSTDCFPQKFRMKRRCQIFSIATRSLVRNLFSLGRGGGWTFQIIGLSPFFLFWQNYVRSWNLIVDIGLTAVLCGLRQFSCYSNWKHAKMLSI